MPGEIDPRDHDIRDRYDGIRDREEHWQVIGREAAIPAEGVRHSRDQLPQATHADPRDAFARDLDLPLGHDRELLRERDRDYRLNGSETRTMATVGAFRVVLERDLQGSGHDVPRLERQGLVERVSVSDRERAVTLTGSGQALLERHRDSSAEHRQAFYAGADRVRERSHDVQIYRAYLREAAKLQEQGASILGVKLDRELKRDYQRFLQERNRGDRHSDGRPDRTVEEIQEWARQHDLPYFDDHVHFPDLRIEYEDVNGDVRWQDIEVTTEHYRGAHGAAASRSGFSIHSTGKKGRGSAFDPRAAEEFL